MLATMRIPLGTLMSFILDLQDSGNKVSSQHPKRIPTTNFHCLPGHERKTKILKLYLLGHNHDNSLEIVTRSVDKLMVDHVNTNYHFEFLLNLRLRAIVLTHQE